MSSYNRRYCGCVRCKLLVVTVGIAWVNCDIRHPNPLVVNFWTIAPLQGGYIHSHVQSKQVSCSHKSLFSQCVSMPFKAGIRTSLLLFQKNAVNNRTIDSISTYITEIAFLGKVWQRHLCQKPFSEFRSWIYDPPHRGGHKSSGRVRRWNICDYDGPRRREWLQFLATNLHRSLPRFSPLTS